MTATTDEQEAFLAAIREVPECDTRRLAFADWLDEHAGTVECETCKRPPDAKNWVPGHIFVGWGHGWQPCPKCNGSGRVPDGSAARAEFIRVQVELARGAPYQSCWCCKGSGQDITDRGGKLQIDECDHCDDWARPNLVRRERELFTAHGAAWYGPHATTVPPTDLESQRLTGDCLIVRRGFVDEARAPLAVLERVLPDLCGRHPVTLAVATDREPDGEATTAPLFHWWRTDRGDDWQDTAEYLPGDLFDMLPGYPVADAGEWRKGFPSERAALDALSAALLLWAARR